MIRTHRGSTRPRRVLVRLFTGLLVRLFACSLVSWFICLCFGPFDIWFVHSLVHWFICLAVRWFTVILFVCSLIRSLVCWFIWLVVRLFVGPFSHLLRTFPSHLSSAIKTDRGLRPLERWFVWILENTESIKKFYELARNDNWKCMSWTTVYLLPFIKENT